MTFDDVLGQVRELLRREKRVSYRGLQRRFALDEAYLEDLKEELLFSHPEITEVEGRGLVWNDKPPETAEETPAQTTTAPATELLPATSLAQPEQPTPAGERRQLTVMFCDVVGSTALSERLDPEDLQTVIRTYQEVSAQVVERYEGYIAQYLGDGLLVYFGYPTAHEDDAARAVRAGLGIISALDRTRSHFPQPVQVRIGIHTGPVVVGQMGGGSRQEELALGETPNIAARVQGQAAPDSVVISTATYSLVQGLFACQDLGPHALKGISAAQSLYQVQSESGAQSRFDVAVRTGLTPLVGRGQELGLLGACWEQAVTGQGQVVLLSGEAGVGKSRLAQAFKDQVIEQTIPAEPTRLEFRCSPYHHNTALYPMLEYLQQRLQFDSADTPPAKLVKLEQWLSRFRFPQAATFPLLAALLSLPPPAGRTPLSFSPQKQKQLTLDALVAWLLEEAERGVAYCSWEDLHWADPSTLELLGVLADQVPTARLLVLLTCRPEFHPPWPVRSSMTSLTLSRLDRSRVEAMITQVAGGKTLPTEIVEQVVTKTDGVPLFVEELVKMVVESDFVTAVNSHYKLTGPLPALAIPSTLHDSLMARLDRLATAKEVAQLGATLGREFSAELLRAVSPWDVTILDQGLAQLVEAELLFRRGLPPHGQYTFKHALVRDTAYQSLLKRTRQQYHERIARVLEDQFGAVVEAQPELVAQHYTEAGLSGPAIAYWYKAGQQASQRSANIEAMSHLNQGLELLMSLPDTPEQRQQELRFQLALGAVQIAARGYASPEARRTFARARELSEQLGDSSQHFPALVGIATTYLVAGEIKTAHQHAAQLLSLAHHQRAAALVVPAHSTFGIVSFWRGEQAVAREHLERAIALYAPHRDNPSASGVAQDHGVISRSFAALALWVLGYPDQALKRTQEALNLARELAHPYSLAFALGFAARLHQLRREGQLTREQAEATITLCTDQGIPFFLALGTVLRGWALAEQGQTEEGITQIRQGLAGWQATGAEVSTPLYLALLAETYGRGGQPNEGLAAVERGLAIADKNEERFYEAELYRLKGELLLNGEFRTRNDEQQKKTSQPSSVHRPSFFVHRSEEAEACFHTAIEIARHQSAKSFELRAAMSLVRLWRQQAKLTEAYTLLAEVYGWFTEGFNTKDLREAKTLLDELT